MAEYSREKRNQLSRAIANNGAGSRPLNGFVDNRCIIGNIIQKKIGNRLSLTDIENENIDVFQQRIERYKECIVSDINAQENKKWKSIGGKSPENIYHTIGRMIDLDGNMYKGYSVPANPAEKKMNKTFTTENVNTICAEQFILRKSGEGNRYIFSLAKDGKGIKKACSKCASTQVLGKHNIIDASLGCWDLFSNYYNVTDVYNRKSKYITACNAYGKEPSVSKEDYVKEQLEKRRITRQYTKNSTKTHKRMMEKKYQKEVGKIEQEYDVLLKEWEEGKPKIDNY